MSETAVQVISVRRRNVIGSCNNVAVGFRVWHEENTKETVRVYRSVIKEVVSGNIKHVHMKFMASTKIVQIFLLS